MPTIRQILLSEWRLMPQAVREYRAMTDTKTGAPSSRVVRHALPRLIDAVSIGNVVSESGRQLDDDEQRARDVARQLRHELQAAGAVLAQAVDWHTRLVLENRMLERRTGRRAFRDPGASLLELAVDLAQESDDGGDDAARSARVQEVLARRFSRRDIRDEVSRALVDSTVVRDIEEALERAWSGHDRRSTTALSVTSALTESPLADVTVLLDGLLVDRKGTVTAEAEEAWTRLLDAWGSLPHLRSDELLWCTTSSPPQPSMRARDTPSGRDERPALFPLELSVEERVLKSIHGNQHPIADSWTAEGLLMADAVASAQRGGVQSDGAQLSVTLAGLLGREVMTSGDRLSSRPAGVARTARSEAQRIGYNAFRAVDELSVARSTSRSLALAVNNPGAYVVYRAWVRIHQADYRENPPHSLHDYWTELAAALYSSRKELARLLAPARRSAVGGAGGGSGLDDVTGWKRDEVLLFLKLLAQQEWGREQTESFMAWCSGDEHTLAHERRRDQWEMLCVVAVDRVAQARKDHLGEGASALVLDDLPTLHQIRLHIRHGAWGFLRGLEGDMTAGEGDAS